MSGRAIILIVAGIIIISSIILFRIEASSKFIVENSAGYYKRQTAYNIAQSGVNLALRQLGNNSKWRTGYTNLPLLTGKVSVTVFDTAFAGIDSAIGIRSKATVQESTFTSTAFGYFPSTFIPVNIKSLITLNGKNGINGNITLDARDHDPYSAVVNPGNGTLAIWSTDPVFAIGGSAQVGGTASGVDYTPSNPASPKVIDQNEKWPGGFPTEPDSIIGIKQYGFPPLKTIAMSGVSGSQYTTDPSTLRYPLSGVTYVEMPNASPANRWNANAVTGTGILIVHNSANNANVDNMNGSFSGLIIGDDVTHLHGDIWGTIISTTTATASNVLGNGNANIYFSRKSILNAFSMLVGGSQLNIIAWWE